MALWLSGCRDGEFQLQTGDLLFQVGRGEMTQAVDAATAHAGDEVSYTHAAIAVVEPEGVYALEAKSESGVVMTPWKEFIAASAMRDGKPVVAVGRLRREDRKQIGEQAVARGKAFLGQPYDVSFRPHNGKIYCSELVWESYRDANGTIFEARPMNFRAADGTMPCFWTSHFEALGEAIPEGVPGTNANDMAKSEKVEIVYRYDL